jgi:outer membrane protein TolC
MLQPNYNDNQHTTRTRRQYKTIRQRYDNDTETSMSQDEQRPAPATFEAAFRGVQSPPGLEATLMARHPELQVKAEQVRPARQEEEQAGFFCGITHARTSGRQFRVRNYV